MTTTQIDISGLLPDEIPTEWRMDELPLAQIDVAEVTSQPDSGLIKNIEEQGILQPITVEAVRNGSSPPRYRVIEGNRRVLVARKLSLGHVPAVIFDAGAYNADIAALSANYLRSHNPLNDYERVSKLLANGFSEEQIARAVHISVKQVQKIRRTGDRLTPTLKTAVEGGAMPFSAAAELVSLPASIVERVEKRLESGEKVTLKDIREERQVRADEATLELPDDMFGPEASGTPSREWHTQNAIRVGNTLLAVLLPLEGMDIPWAKKWAAQTRLMLKKDVASARDPDSMSASKKPSRT